MKAVSYVTWNERTSPLWCKAFSKGCGGDICDDGELRPGPVAMFGSARLWGILEQAQGEGRDWFYGDHGYFGRFRYYRITRNDYQHRGVGIPDFARFRAHNIPIRPMRSGGRHILICPPDEKFARLMRFNAGKWLSHTLEILRTHTSRPLIVRSRAQAASGRPLAEDLIDCWALVTYMSNAATEAILNGIPVFCLGRCSASSMGSRDLSLIERPILPGVELREHWAAVLAANQWTLPEMADGTAWRALTR